MSNSRQSLNDGVIQSAAMHDLIMKDHTSETLEMNRKHLDHYRRTGLDMSMAQESSEGEEMKILATGDVHVSQNPNSGNASSGNDFIKLLAVAGMAAGIPMAGIAGYLLSQKPAPIPVVSEPENTTIERDYQIGEVLVE